MPENPISAIENAELIAKQVVQKANEEKAALLFHTRKEADQNLKETAQKANLDGERILKEVEQARLDTTATLELRLEAEKANLSFKAEQYETAAINAILEIVGKTL